MQVGTAESIAGEVTTGYLSVTELPTGASERVPVIIGDGAEDGPTLWVTASIHGDELTGLTVAQDVLDEALVNRLRGTVICLPNLNPAGLRRTARTSYYDGDDPNRYFPNGSTDSARPPRVQEVIDSRLFERITETATALVSLHTSWVGSMQFSIRSRVPYGTQRDEAEASELALTVDRLVSAFGLPIVNEFPPEQCAETNLNRSMTSALVETAGIPAFTPELGGRFIVEERSHRIGVTGVRNVMRELGMLDAEPVPNDDAPTAPVDFAVRRSDRPHTPTAGIVRHRVRPGDVVQAGDRVADIVTPTGEHRDSIHSPRDGFVLNRREGIAVYENDPVLSMAVRDDEGLVVPAEKR